MSAANFVRVKLSGRENTDAMSLSHGTLVSPKDAPDYLLWRRWDALVKGWILGSLSEQAVGIGSLQISLPKMPANHVRSLLLQDGKEESTQPRRQVDPKAKKEAKARADIHQNLYPSALHGRWEDLQESISIKGNTALHIYHQEEGTSGECVETAPEDTLLGMQISDGSTLLHVAATVEKQGFGETPGMVFTRSW